MSSTPPYSLTTVPDRWLRLHPGGEFIRASAIESIWDAVVPEGADELAKIRTLSGHVYAHSGDNADALLDLVLGVRKKR